MTAARVVSLGCRLNAAEAATIETLLARASDGDTLVVNTCAVTGEAERDGLAAIRRLRRENPAARIVATGCAVQLDPARYESLPEIDAVVGNAVKLDPASWIARESTAPGFDGRPAFVEDAPGFAEDRTRAFVEVQQGCDHRCTFCVIPFARGPSRSLPTERAVARVRQAVAAGRREVVLTGVDLTAWGSDLPGAPRLGALCARILEEVPELVRLRLSSVDPAELDDGVFDLLAREKRFAPSLHLSLQHGDDLILKRMKRRHTAAQAREVAARARTARPDIALAADLIAGFPTESETAFANMLALVETLGLAQVHAFAYSPRPGTPAARMRPLPPATVKTRAKALRAAAAAARARYLDGRIGGPAEVLVESSGTDGLDAQGQRVRLAASAPRGALVEVRVAGHDGTRLEAAAR